MVLPQWEKMSPTLEKFVAPRKEDAWGESGGQESRNTLSESRGKRNGTRNCRRGERTASGQRGDMRPRGRWPFIKVKGENPRVRMRCLISIGHVN